MGMYNDVRLSMPCPACGASSLVAQVHAVTSPSGDHRGRFCLQTYDVGDEMWWFEKDHPEYAKIFDDPNLFDVGDLKAERCHVECSACRSQFCSRILFRERRIVEAGALIDIDWAGTAPISGRECP